MSVSFDRPATAAALSMLTRLLGQPSASDQDRRIFLFDDARLLDGRKMTEVANVAKQSVTVELHSKGEIKEMGDGTRYQVTDRGWKKL